MTEGKRNQKQKGFKVTTVPMPFALGEIQENITINTNTFSKPTKEQIINQAIQYHLKGNISEATKCYQYCINQDFNDPNVFLNYGTILQDLGKLKEAELSIRKSIKIKPDFAEAHSNLGIILNDIGKLQEAELSIRKAIEINPNFAKAYYSLSLILSKSKKYKEALSIIDECLIHEPNNHLYEGEKKRIEFILSL